jgi:alpha-tubulin suppressor-like RCC1 family protein
MPMKPDKPRDICEKTEIFFYGIIPIELKKNPFDLSSLGTFTNYQVKKIVFGLEHCIIQFKNVKNELGLFGSNEYGQLGMDIKPVIDDKGVNYYSKLSLLKTKFEETSDFEIVDMAAHDLYTLVLVSFKNKAKFGKFNYIYKFAHEEKDKLKLDKVEENINVIKKEEFKYNTNGMIIQIYTHENRDVILTEDNSIYVKGSNFNLEIFEKYKMTIEKFEKNIKYLCLGKNHMLIFTADHNLFAIGDNEYGELGIEGLKYTSEPKKIVYFDTKEEKIKKACAGGRHSLVLTESNTVYSFGDNSEGQCTGQNAANLKPKKIKFAGSHTIIDIFSGYNHSLALSSKGEVFSWGDTSSGKLGYVTGVSTQSTPKVIPFLNSKNVSMISCGPMQTAILTSTFQNSLIKNYTTIDN